MKNSYFENLLKSSKASKKQIAVYLDDDTVERLDLMIRIFSSISDSKSFSRNTLIEEAVSKYIAEAEKYLKDEMDVDIEQEIEQVRSGKSDTVIFSAKGRGFEEVFMGESQVPCWYPCRVRDGRESGLKYIAIYRGTPISAITHYAKIKRIEFDEEKNCKVCYFDDPIELPNQIGLGSKDSCFFIGTKYTTIESLLNAATADEITFTC